MHSAIGAYGNNKQLINLALLLSLEEGSDQKTGVGLR